MQLIGNNTQSEGVTILFSGKLQDICLKEWENA